MTATILEHVKGSELLDTLKKLQPDPNQIFRVILEPENESEKKDMPPEEMISDELINSVKRSEECYKSGKGTICKNKKESAEFFNKIWNE